MRTWHSATLTRRALVDEGLVEVQLAMPPEVTASFVRPGQFQTIRFAGDAAFFAIASAPGATAFDYLVRRGTGVSEALSLAALGTRLDVTLAEGPGFPLEVAAGHDLLLVATGTAIAPVRSVLGVVARRRADFKRVTLLQGQRNPRQLPWLAEFSRLPDLDLRTTVTEGAPSWRGPVGFVQALVPSAVTADTVAFLVGQPEMTAEVTRSLRDAGVPGERIFLNV